MRDTEYAKELASASVPVKGQRKEDVKVERLLIKETNVVEIRWSWWVEGRMMNRPLDLPEDMLLTLFQAGMKKSVFTTDFLVGLRNRIDAHLASK